jgi:hypothetical protein
MPHQVMLSDGKLPVYRWSTLLHTGQAAFARHLRDLVLSQTGS